MSEKELSKEELLEPLCFVFRYYINSEEIPQNQRLRGKQAYHQIRKLIENQPEITDVWIEEWLEENWDENILDEGLKTVSGFKITIRFLKKFLKDFLKGEGKMESHIF